MDKITRVQTTKREEFSYEFHGEEIRVKSLASRQILHVNILISEGKLKPDMAL